MLDFFLKLGVLFFQLFCPDFLLKGCRKPEHLRTTASAVSQLQIVRVAFLTLTSSESGDYHDIDMKFDPHKDQITKNKSVSLFQIKNCYSQLAMSIFLNKTFLKFLFIYLFCNKTKTKAFLENRAHTFFKCQEKLYENEISDKPYLIQNSWSSQKS